MRRKLCAALLLAVLLCLFAPIARAVECTPGQHKYIETGRIPATAMEDGEIDYTCTACGHEYTDILFATEHLWGDWITIQEPTCTQPGQRRRTCTRAQPHHETAVIPALGHDYKETRIEPSCLNPGKKIFVCANNPIHTYEELIPAHGDHSFGAWNSVTPARENAQGLETRKCIRCDLAESRAIEALPTTLTEPPTEPTTEPRTEPSTEPSTESSRTIPALDIVLISANIAALGWFAFLLIPYFMGLAFARRRRKAQEERAALRKEVDELHGYE